MKLKLILLLSVVALAASDPFRMNAVRAHDLGRDHLSHTKFILEGQDQLSKRHHLQLHHNEMAYTEVPLNSTHYGFNLQLKVDGLFYEMSMDTGSSDIFIKG